MTTERIRQETPTVLVLIGLRASGKTTLGKQLAAATGWSFVDLDAVALADCVEPDIHTVFDKRGEDAWREAEAAALKQQLEGDRVVLALGGGAPTVETIENSLRTEQSWGRVRVVFLDAPNEVLAERMGKTNTGARPALGVSQSNLPCSPLEELILIRNLRQQVFESLADATVDTSGSEAEALARVLNAAAIKQGPSA